MTRRVLGEQEARCFSVILPVDLVTQIDRRIQDVRGVSRSSIIREAIQNYLNPPAPVEPEPEPPKHTPRRMRRRK